MKGKTNAMRLLEQAGIPYTPLEYEVDESDLSGMHIARQLGRDPDTMFKTIAVRGEKRGILVFCIPVSCEIDLKKAARVAGDKRVELLPVKELLSTTGYIRGGCSPIGMKKEYPTVFHETAEIVDTIMVSAGKIGYQVELSPTELIDLVGAELADVTVDQ